MPEKSSLTLSCSSLLAQKSPKLIGLPRPYTPKFYSSGSYMANRPSYIGSYRRPDISSSDAKPSTFSLYTKLPGLRNDPMETISTYSSSKTPTSNSNDSTCNNIDFSKSEQVNSRENEDEKCAYTKTNCVNYVNSSGETEVCKASNHIIGNVFVIENNIIK